MRHVNIISLLIIRSLPGHLLLSSVYRKLLTFPFKKESFKRDFYYKFRNALRNKQCRSVHEMTGMFICSSWDKRQIVS
jgi:hypothetical protein